jgi:hypothetical protein
MILRPLLLLAALPAVASAQAPPRLPDHVSIDLQRRLAPLGRQFGVAFVFPREPKSAGRGTYSYEPIADDRSEVAERYVDLFVEEFGKYPTDFIKASKLKRVLFVQGLAVGQQKRAAFPETRGEDLLFDVTAVHNERYARHVVHHELYHMLEDDWNGSAYYKDPNWSLLNEAEFQYGAGGAAYQTGSVWEFNHPKTGFINIYATSGLEEDKAEIWAVMFVSENWKMIEPMLASDPVLRAKVSYMREFGRSKSPAMGVEFWSEVSQRQANKHPSEKKG